MANKKTYHLHKAGKKVSLFFILVLLSCSNHEKEWAKVNDVLLTEADALLLMEKMGYDSKSPDDCKQFTNEWIERQVFIQELQKTAPEEAELIKLKTQWHQGDLSRFYLEESYIQKEIEIELSDSLIIDYFNRHKEDFSLNDYIVRALYIKVPKEAPNQEQLKQHYLLKKDKDYSKVISYSKLYADNFYYDDSTWVYFDELTKDAPTEKFNKDNLVLNRTKTYFSDEQFTYYLNIIDFKFKNTTPPVDFLKPTIKQLLISNKLNELKEKNGTSFIQKIKQKHEITSKY